jgi:hypothetical protein
MHSGDFGTKSHCRKAIVTNFPAGNPKMLCIFGGTDKSVPYNPIVIWRSAKQQLIELFSGGVSCILSPLCTAKGPPGGGPWVFS